MSTRVAGCSDTVMQTLWRAVVRKEWGEKCALEGKQLLIWKKNGAEPCFGELQAHHIIKRRRPHLKHVPANGMLLCAHHHNLVENYTPWRTLAEQIVGTDKMEWLTAESRKLLPDFLAERGQTRKEWLTEHKAYLQALVKGAA